MSAPSLSELYGEAKLATQRLLAMLNRFRHPLGEPPILVEGLARREVEARYALAVEAELRAKRNYEAEMLILILPYPAYGFVEGKRTIRAEFKVLGTRATIPSDTSADILIYGVSELGLEEYWQLAEECNNVLIAEQDTECALSSTPYEPHGVLYPAISAAKARYAVRAILDTAPRLGFLRVPKSAAVAAS
jgi:hypothetical protein